MGNEKITNLKDLEDQIDLKGILPIQVVNSPIFNKIAVEIYNGWAGRTGRERIIEKAKFIASILPEYSKMYSKNYVETLEIIAEARNVNYTNWFQNGNIPQVKDVLVYKNVEDFKAKHPEGKFICPKCEGESTNAYTCDCKGCDWKVYGLFGDLGKGVNIFLSDNIKENPVPQNIFKPINL